MRTQIVALFAWTAFCNSEPRRRLNTRQLHLLGCLALYNKRKSLPNFAPQHKDTRDEQNVYQTVLITVFAEAWLNADFSLRKFVCNCTGPGLQEGADSRRPGHWPHISLLKRIKILLPRTVRPVQLVCTELFAGCLAIIQCQLTGMPSLARVVRCVATQIIITSAIMINSLRQQL